ncbi:MAG TPA: hypothetical protein VHK69_22630 [Chitinophagaceae bacterium]|nr:hypothetical protein [Chitinophagaceae bacterium]
MYEQLYLCSPLLEKTGSQFFKNRNFIALFVPDLFVKALTIRKINLVEIKKAVTLSSQSKERVVFHEAFKDL